MKRGFLMISLILAGAVSGLAQTTFYYPQVANGVLGATIWRTTIFMTNPVAGTLASGVIEFTTSAGAPFVLSVVDEAGTPFNGNMIPFQIGGGQTKKFVSSGAGAYNGGFATVTSNATVSGTAIFSSFTLGGQLVGEAGVPAGSAVPEQAIVVDTVGGFQTAVAYANPTTSTALVTLSLINSAGVLVASTPQNLVGRNQVPKFVGELFPAAPPMVGSMRISSPVPLAAIALRFDPSFALFTTLPPVTLASIFRPAIEFFQQRPWGSPFAAIAGLITNFRHRIG